MFLFHFLIVLAATTFNFGDTLSTAQKQKFLEKVGTKVLLMTPDVSSCINKRTYNVNHILYVCFHYGRHGTTKALIPMACATEVAPIHQRINMNKQWKDQFFVYKCLKEGEEVKFKPLNCHYQDVEILPGKTIRVNNNELTCIQHAEGDLSLIVKKFMHNFCSTGGRNETLASEDKCPGTTKTISHSKYGAGSKVRLNSLKNQLLKN